MIDNKFAATVDIPVCTVARDTRGNGKWIASASDNYKTAAIPDVTQDSVNDWVTDHIFDGDDASIGPWCTRN